ncbi:2-polyprenyl-3-methyl-6-methoxy-1,4-benzoquinone monooxygenase [Undibacterium sp. CY18W]|uniref:3-demethoxyubiquinol 3-hydroxylase n=1 Tax=Undibacterium hunanense TaxID=2762292 RepID=A0ABR6ZNV5_9BURK|nr:2-polyprenyl-3-methyl-6-methoxy-1,4-benzoquinone monooxygenase [Undibacterium hunanense]MBC3917575.1 2-polyprenyl-3-methyl-6-methoxy-1,4-benzoquinone monooxygenase [Undibacterium hunanense]
MLAIDHLILGLDRALRVVNGQARSRRDNPAQGIAEANMSDEEKAHSAGLMRVNHVGEICAQALYDAQGAFTKTEDIRQQFQHSGIEEEDHLAWTAGRLKELNSHTSLLNPLWYAGAYAVGALAAKSGDKLSLGFVVETERQVEAHLASHLDKLPVQDVRSRAIVEQMRVDEIAHGAAAQSLGASELPVPVRAGMKFMAKIMTASAYYI